MQDSLKAGLEASVIPAFERSCKAIFDQVDAAFRRGMVEHTAAAQQHFEASHSSLALTLRVCILKLKRRGFAAWMLDESCPFGFLCAS